MQRTMLILRHQWLLLVLRPWMRFSCLLLCCNRPLEMLWNWGPGPRDKNYKHTQEVQKLPIVKFKPVSMPLNICIRLNFYVKYEQYIYLVIPGKTISNYLADSYQTHKKTNLAITFWDKFPNITWKRKKTRNFKQKQSSVA